MENVKLMQGDCLELVKDIPDGSIDMILCDLPYGTIKGAGLDGWDKDKTQWDERLNTAILFIEYERVLRENGIIVLFSQEPYTSELRSYNATNIEFAYSMVWEKDHFANALISKKAPVSYFEDLSVFYKKYDFQNLNPLRKYSTELMKWIGLQKKEIIGAIGQKADHFFRITSTQYKLCTEATYEELIEKFHIDSWGGFKPYRELAAANSKFQRVFNLPENKKCIGNVLKFKKEYQGLHPTQKPVALLEYLVKTYTNEGDIVLDNCMGSGSTGVACVNTGRRFIGIELDEGYFEIARNRIGKAAKEPMIAPLFEKPEFEQLSLEDTANG